MGPDDNRPSTKYLKNFFQKKSGKKEEEKHMRHETWHGTRDTWHLTYNMWCGVNILSNFEGLEEKGELIN